MNSFQLQRCDVLTQNGWTASRIAEALGVSIRTVRRWRNRDTVVQPKQKRYIPINLWKALQATPIVTQRQLASKFGVHQSTISRWLHRFHYTRKKARPEKLRQPRYDAIKTYKCKLCKLRQRDHIFVDETSVYVGVGSLHRFGWTKRGNRLQEPKYEGRRVRYSLCIAMNIGDAVTFWWSLRKGSFKRISFERFMKPIEKNNPTKTVVLDNASIHRKGGKRLFLPPYCPQLNPVDIINWKLKSKIKWSSESVLRRSIHSELKRVTVDEGKRIVRHCCRGDTLGAS